MKKHMGLLGVVLAVSTVLCACGKGSLVVDKNNTRIENTEADFAENEKKESMNTETSDAVVSDAQGLEDAPSSSEAVAETPGPDIVNLVNLRGDETTGYKLVDGTYMDRIDRKFTYNGTDAWFDEDGVEWNEKVD